MARLSRLSIANHQHHVLQRGNDNRVIFQDTQDIALFRKVLLEASKKYDVAIHAYVFMPTHFHLLLTPKSDDGIGKMMQWLGRHYVPYFNKKVQRVGTLWQGRFKSLVIESAEYFLLCSRYIETNPVRSGLVQSPIDYADSSCLHHIGVKLDALITDHPLYWNLGNTPFQREAAYRELLEQALTLQQINEFTAATLKGWPVGSVPFKNGLEKQVSRRIAPLKRGRPRTKKIVMKNEVNSKAGQLPNPGADGATKD